MVWYIEYKHKPPKLCTLSCHSKCRLSCHIYRIYLSLVRCGDGVYLSLNVMIHFTGISYFKWMRRDIFIFSPLLLLLHHPANHSSKLTNFFIRSRTRSYTEKKKKMKSSQSSFCRKIPRHGYNIAAKRI